MINTIKFIYNHPFNINKKCASVLRFLKWQASGLLWNQARLFDWIDDSRLVISKGMTGATGNIYVGLMEYEDMSFLLHYLHEDDLFFDIGANVGAYTILASKVKKANTICVEPLPSTYDKLLDNININRLQNVIAKNIGLSFEKTKLYFTTDRDTMNSVAVDSDVNKQEIMVDILDSLSAEYDIPKIMKIDVEGYETNVLLGAKKSLLDDKLEVIILELNGSGEKFGFYDNDIHKSLLVNGFMPYTYNPFARELINLEKYGTHNTIYIRKNKVDKIKLALKKANTFTVNGMSI